jgi:uncharacterized RDD family membrane protein YckC
MRWLWFVGPLFVLLILLWISIWPGREENRLRAEVTRWLDELLGPLWTKKGEKGRRVRRIPDPFNALVDLVGGGTRITDAVLLPSLAYLAVRAGDNLRGSSHVTVVCKLGKPGPTFQCRPLPIVDGRLAENRGVVFKGDEIFREAFEVSGADSAAIIKWLTPELREALLELPEVWLRVERDVMALTLYGCPDADAIDELVGAADAVFAERGASSESLYGPEPAAAKKPAKTDAEVVSKRGYRGKPEEAREKPAAIASAKLRLEAAAVDLGLYLVASALVAAMLGAFASFHPAVFFSSPDLTVDEPWMGGWTTKGFGAFTAAECLLIGLFSWQSYLGARGRSIGKLLFGARVVQLDGSAVDFQRGVVRRTWLLAALPLLSAAVRARPFSARSFFLAIPHWTTAVAALLVLAVAVASALRDPERRGVHDRIAGTKVVDAEPFALPTVQLGMAGLDPVVLRRLLGIGAITVVYLAVNLIGWFSSKGLWYDWVF